MTKDLPNSPEAEIGVISCILLDGAPALSKALDGKLAPECFHEPKHAKIFKTLLWLHKNNKPLEVDVLAEELRELGRLEDVGGLSGLMEASRAQPTTARFEHCIEKVRENYVRRELIKVADETKERALAYSGNVEDFVAATHRILSIRHASQPQKTLADAADESIARAERIIAGEETEDDKGYPWPWPDFNKKFGPAMPGELIVIGARPSCGKSSIIRQIMMAWADQIGVALLFSREMPVGQLPELFAQSISGYSWRHFRRRELHVKEQAEFMSALREVKQMKRLRILDRDRTLSQLTARIKAYGQMEKVKAVAVDYLQRYDPQQERGETRDVALGRMSMACKDTAIELAIPVLLACQIGRGVVREQREPRVDDLRESGNIEQDADRVWLIHVPAEKPDGSTQDLTDDGLLSVYVEVLQAKGRGEGQARVPLIFHRPTTTFKSYTSNVIDI